MAGDWLKMIADVADALGAFDESRRGGGMGAYLRGESMQTDPRAADVPDAYERWLTRPRDPSVNDR